MVHLLIKRKLQNDQAFKLFYAEDDLQDSHKELF
jgi:hypothetical protein